MSLTRSLEGLFLRHNSNVTLHFTNKFTAILSKSRFFGISSCKLAGSPNEDYVVSPVYRNRNPRNLEQLGLARKRLGWQFQAPRKDYYLKLVISNSHRNTEAWIEHSSGAVVVSASTKEWAIRDQLYSCSDVSASENIGIILAQRCLESGITAVFYDEADIDKNSQKLRSILKAFQDAQISLKEPEMVVPEYTPGINYDGYNRYAEPKIWREDYQDV